MSIAVLLTSFNRKSKTLATLESLFAQALPDSAGTMSVYLVDDGSTDGTSEAIAEKFPQVSILIGTGKLFWNGGMHLAFETALRHGYDFYLWLNDDTSIIPNAIDGLLTTSLALGGKNIVVGSTKDPDTRAHTYGGVWRSSRWHPFKFSPVIPEDVPLPADTMNGNCVLIPAEVAQAVGNLDPAFTHGIGDFDYGLRARRLGFGVQVMPGYVGWCKRNDPKNSWRDSSLPVSTRWSKFTSPHGLPPHEWAVFAKRHGGWLWPVYWVAPYWRGLIPEKNFFGAKTNESK